MSTSFATKSTFHYVIFVAVALGFFFAGLTASALGFAFSERQWLNTAIYAAIIPLNALNVVAVLP